MLHDKHKQWIEARGIPADLAEKLGLETTRDGAGFWLSVPYVERGQVVNHKYRQTSEKKHRMDQGAPLCLWNHDVRSEEHTSELQSLMRISYAVFCLKKKKNRIHIPS